MKTAGVALVWIGVVAFLKSLGIIQVVDWSIISSTPDYYWFIFKVLSTNDAWYVWKVWYEWEMGEVEKSVEREHVASVKVLVTEECKK